jgi:hypothetical protein
MAEILAEEPDRVKQVPFDFPSKILTGFYFIRPFANMCLEHLPEIRAFRRFSFCSRHSAEAGAVTRREFGQEGKKYVSLHKR